ncbi:MAG: glycosyltransferase [Methylococcales bacterium]
MNGSLKNVLHVTHSWGGGIPVYISDLQHILRDQYALFTLKCSHGTVILEKPKCDEDVLCFTLPSPLGLLETRNEGYAEIIELVLQAYEIELIHVNITLSHSLDVFYAARKLNIPVVYTVHDYFYICPTFHLVDHNGQLCHQCSYGDEDEECLRGHPYINNKKFDKNKLYEWRSEFFKVKDVIAQYVFPSHSCEKIFSSFYDIPSEICRVIPHGVSLREDVIEKKSQNKELRVGILGTMLKHKGESLYNEILKNINSERFKFYHFGDGELDSDKLISIGAYTRTSINDLLTGNKIDVILLLSTWPETFSYTLSETFFSGIPPIVTNLGALAERVKVNKAGWIVDYESPEEICNLLNQLELDRGLIDEKREILSATPPDSLVEMKAEYINLYSDMTGQRSDKTFDESVKSKASLSLDAIRTRCNPDIINSNGLGALELFERSMREDIEA